MTEEKATKIVAAVFEENVVVVMGYKTIHLDVPGAVTYRELGQLSALCGSKDITVYPSSDGKQCLVRVDL